MFRLMAFLRSYYNFPKNTPKIPWKLYYKMKPKMFKNKNIKQPTAKQGFKRGNRR